MGNEGQEPCHLKQWEHRYKTVFGAEGRNDLRERAVSTEGGGAELGLRRREGKDNVAVAG